MVYNISFNISNYLCIPRLVVYSIYKVTACEQVINYYVIRLEIQLSLRNCNLVCGEYAVNALCNSIIDCCML